MDGRNDWMAYCDSLSIDIYLPNESASKHAMTQKETNEPAWMVMAKHTQPKILTAAEQAEHKKQEQIEGIIIFSVSLVLFVVVVFVVMKIKNKLDTTQKRAWSVVAVAGSILLVYGLYTWDYYGDAIDSAFYFDGAYNHPSIFFGFWMSVFGYMFSWFYNVFAGRVVKWIKLG